MAIFPDDLTPEELKKRREIEAQQLAAAQQVPLIDDQQRSVMALETPPLNVPTLPETQLRNGMPPGIPELISSNQRLAQDLRPAERNVPTLGEAGDYLSETAANVPGSAQQLAVDTITPLLSPVETAKTMGELAQSVAGKLGIGDASPEMANAVGQYFTDRYGGFEQTQNTFRDDPVGVFADVAGVFLGGTGLARAATTGIGKAAKATTGRTLKATPGVTKALDVVNKVGDIIDPANVVLRGTGKTLGVLGQMAAPVSGFFSGVGADMLKQHFNITRKGGGNTKVMNDAVREGITSEMTEKVMAGHRELGKKQSEAFVSAKNNLKLKDIEATPEQLVAVKNLVTDYKENRTFNNMLELSPEAVKKADEIQKRINIFSADNRNFNAAGLDSLKRQIDKLYPTGLKVGDAGAVVAELRNNVKNMVLDVAGEEYGRVMKTYEDAAEASRIIQKELSLGGASIPSTRLRKIRKATKDPDVQQALNKIDPTLMPQVVGSAFTDIMPVEGMTRFAGSIPAILNLGAGNIPALAVQAMAQSPRLSGVASGAAGRVARGVDQIGDVITAGDKVPLNIAKGAAYAGRERNIAEGLTLQEESTVEEIMKLIQGP